MRRPLVFSVSGGPQCPLSSGRRTLSRTAAVVPPRAAVALRLIAPVWTSREITRQRIRRELAAPTPDGS